MKYVQTARHWSTRPHALLALMTPHNLVLQEIVVKVQPLDKPRTHDQNLIWFVSWGVIY